MPQTRFPTIEEALWLHEVVIQRFGGKGGIRDPGLLDSALHRPRSGYYSSLSMQAAALLQSLARNHCFVDGNKRMAFALTAIFLHMNGYALKVSADEGEHFMVSEVIHGQADIDRIAGWIEHHVTRI